MWIKREALVCVYVNKACVLRCVHTTTYFFFNNGHTARVCVWPTYLPSTGMKHQDILGLPVENRDVVCSSGLWPVLSGLITREEPTVAHGGTRLSRARGT